MWVFGPTLPSMFPRIRLQYLSGVSYTLGADPGLERTHRVGDEIGTRHTTSESCSDFSL
jgi:hypothetical protein